jgi:hypothetical protein
MNPDCRDCAALGRQCALCAGFERIHKEMAPVWARRRKARQDWPARRERERQAAFATWPDAKQPRKIEPPKKVWESGADKSLPVGDRD